MAGGTMQQRIVVGMDIGDDFTQIAIQKTKEEEPLSLSPITGGSRYLIPTVIGKKKDVGQWSYGEEVLKNTYVIKCSKLLSKALHSETVYLDGTEYLCIDLLALYLKKVLSLGARYGYQKETGFLVVATSNPDFNTKKLLTIIFDKIGIPNDHFEVISHNQALGHYVMAKTNEQDQHDVLLYEYWAQQLIGRYLKVHTHHSPILIEPQEVIYDDFQKQLETHYDFTIDERNGLMDQMLLDIVEQDLKKGSVSTCFLVGEGFQQEWMKKSLLRIATGRKAYIGNNLYTKGACYASYYQDQDEKRYILIDSSISQYNFYVKARNKGEYQYITLLSAGRNILNSKGKLDFILEQEEQIEVEISNLFGNKLEAIIIPLKTILPYHSRKRRVCLEIECLDADIYEINLIDCGFGTEVTPLGNIWKKQISLEVRS